jgi:TonB family protein
MIVRKGLALAACLAFLPAHADGVGRTDKSSEKQLSVDLNSCAKPEWPRESLRWEQQGAVTLAFLIGLDGKVLESKVVESSGYPLLDMAAQDGIAQCKFTPPNSVGRSEPTWMKMKYVWTLKDNKTPEQRQADLESDLALARQGDAAAMYRLSSRYMRGKADVQRDVEEGLRLLRQSAELGYAPAQEALGLMLSNGREVAADPVEGRAWMEKAAAQGLASGQFGLGMLLMFGRDGPQDKPRGRELLELSAAQDNLMAKSALGRWLILEGGDPERGLKLVEEAAGRQDRQAQFTLAEVLEKGELRPQDHARALALYRRAAASGYGPAQGAVVRLALAAVK